MTVLRHATLALLLTGVVAAQPRVLSGHTAEATGPQVVAAPDGTVHLVHLASDGGDSAVVHRLWDNGFWTSEEILARAPDALYDVQIAMSADGTAHAAWTQGSDGAIFLRSLRDEDWSPALEISDDGSRPGEYPSLAARPDGGVEIVWQALVAGEFQTVHASVGPDGAVESRSVIDIGDSDGFAIAPQVFLTPVPVVIWYEVIDGELALRAAERLPGPEWRRLTLVDLIHIDLSHLPVILQTEIGEWAALWEGVEGDSDSVFLGLGGPPLYGLGLPIEGPGGDSAEDPAAISLDPLTWAIAWTSRSPEGGESVHLTLVGPEGEIDIPVAWGDGEGFTRPTLCATGDAVHVVWTARGGSGGERRPVHASVTLP